ncbi:hypothetical protein [Iningainema tapete]|uniref:Uncharacterized protein n=1 Tax=Iningainema tapete BLCC-T55 TaxID=2748662 RepID=A0A8J6XEU6_9CYAN|nr:hypothetical protein [Iningainema tapete]MBD2771430.1 hypothetical protein [Iningainema tapete BLCC-T55]
MKASMARAMNSANSLLANSDNNLTVEILPVSDSSLNSNSSTASTSNSTSGSGNPITNSSSSNNSVGSNSTSSGNNPLVGGNSTTNSGISFSGSNSTSNSTSFGGTSFSGGQIVGSSYLWGWDIPGSGNSSAASAPKPITSLGNVIIGNGQWIISEGSSPERFTGQISDFIKGKLDSVIFKLRFRLPISYGSSPNNGNPFANGNNPFGEGNQPVLPALDYLKSVYGENFPVGVTNSGNLANGGEGSSSGVSNPFPSGNDSTSSNITPLNAGSSPTSGGSNPFAGGAGGGSNPFAGGAGGGSNPFAGGAGGGSNPFAGGAGGGSNPFAGGAGSGSNPFAGGAGGGSNPFAGGAGGGSNPFAGGAGGGSNPFADESNSSAGGSNPFAGSDGAPQQSSFDISKIVLGGMGGDGSMPTQSPTETLKSVRGYVTNFTSSLDFLFGSENTTLLQKPSDLLNLFRADMYSFNSGIDTVNKIAASDSSAGGASASGTNQFASLFGGSGSGNNPFSSILASNGDIPYDILSVALEGLLPFNNGSDNVFSTNEGELPIGKGNRDFGSGNAAIGNANWNYGNNNASIGNGNWNWDSSTNNATVGNGNWNLDYTSNNRTVGNGNWYWNSTSYNKTLGNGNWHFGNNNTTLGNGNFDFGNNNTVIGNGNWVFTNNSIVIGNGNWSVVIDKSTPGASDLVSDIDNTLALTLGVKDSVDTLVNTFMSKMGNAFLPLTNDLGAGLETYNKLILSQGSSTGSSTSI